MHSDAGLKRFLARPWVYAVFSRVLSRRAPGWLIRDYAQPFAGCRVLDLGCGPNGQLDSLPETVSDYTGVDINPAYIAAARRRHGRRDGCTFVHADLASYLPSRSGAFDIALAVGVLHHLDDATARRVLTLAYDALAPGGRMVTCDPVYVDGQSRVARWLLNHDRGRAVRTVDGYRALVEQPFEHRADAVLHDTLRVPYTNFVMTLTKTPGHGR